MPRIQVLDLDVADESTTGFASNVTGATFTLTANAPTDGIAHQVSIHNDSATDHSGKTVTLVGTDADGKALTEVVTAPAGTATVESTGYFLTLTSATPSATIGADTFDIGWVDEISSRTVPLNRHANQSVTVQVDVTGTINYTVQQTATPLNDVSNIWPIAWINAGSPLAGATADQISLAASSLQPHITAIRVITTSYSSGAELQVYISEEGGV